MTRRFLFLQGPHGPFFSELASGLRAAGCQVERVLFNRGDRLYSRSRSMAYAGLLGDWPDALARIISEGGFTDIALYGDTKPVHVAAKEAADAAGLRLHVFEEGYLRPWWVTYERGGSNGHSRLMTLGLDQICSAVAETGPPVEAPEGWGALRRHMAYGALYHAAVLSGGPHFQHRDVSVRREAALHVRRLFALPLHALQRRSGTRALTRKAAPYHLVLLQLDHDANFRHHGPFPDTPAFVETVVRGFATGAPKHHRLVFKAHPLEDGRVPLAPAVRAIAREHGVEARTHFIPGGKLASLLDGASTAVTVNSTAAQQALWRGLPVKAFGESVYARPEFVSDQPLPAFFADPTPPDRRAYVVFRQFLLESSQVPGSFYAARGRRQLCRRLVDMMLDERDPYEARLAPIGAARPQHLSAVRRQIGMRE